MAELAVNDLALRYGDNEILRGVSVTRAAGQGGGAARPSGSGKTTLLRAVAGLETPYTRHDPHRRHSLLRRRAHIDLPAEERGLGLVFQSYALWPHRTVFDNVAYGLKLRKVARRDIKTRVDKALAQIGLAHLADRYPHQLSGGQQQRVALARALVYEPPVILLDEPLSNLDAKLREEARAWLRSYRLARSVRALVTHDQIEAMAIADRITLLNGGLIEQEGTPTELYTRAGNRFRGRVHGQQQSARGHAGRDATTRPRIEVMGMKHRRHRAPNAVDRARRRRADPHRERCARRRAWPEPHPDAAQAQMYLGERWELVFAKDALTVRVYATAPLRHEFYHVEFPSTALWIFRKTTQPQIVRAASTVSRSFAP